MDSLRGHIGAADYGGDHRDYDLADEDAGLEHPPSPVGQDERRMQVRAYNHWASQLGDRNFPAIEDLDPESLTDFGPYSVLLDFTAGIDDPAIQYLGEKLGQECGADESFEKLSDVPSRSLLSRITDHYMQILANQAPIGFEAEFVNQRGTAILYRGILLPYSSDDDTIDFIYGVINWKEMADQLTSDELLLEIDQALEGETADARTPDPVTDWADGPGAAATLPRAPLDLSESDDPFPLPAFGAANDEAGTAPDLTLQDEVYELADEDEGESEDLYEAIEAVDEEPESETRFASLLGLGGTRVGRAPLDLGEHGFGEREDEDEFGEDDYADQAAALAAWQTPRIAPDEVQPSTRAPIARPTEQATAFEDAPLPVETMAADVEDFTTEVPHVVEAEAAGDDAELGLYDCLAAARELALAARSCEDRSRSALYAAVGRAYDFSLAAQAEPDEFANLIADSGLTVQERAPMTPVVKLVFGADYDKTRLTEYAAVLSHAHRMQVERGTLARLLGETEGGLKGVVQAERDYRRAEGGEAPVRETPREALARKLRAIAPLGFEDISAEGHEFALVMIRRTQGEVLVLGEVSDVTLVEKAAKKLVA